MAKHRGNKHASRGVIGKPPSFKSGSTTDSEKRLGLERGGIFLFAPAITTEAAGMNGQDQKNVKAKFSRATFIRSDGNTLFFQGRPVDKANQHNLIMTFTLSEREFKSCMKIEVGASLGEAGEDKV